MQRTSLDTLAVLFVVVLFGCILLVRGFIAHATDEYVTFTVTDKERIQSDQSSKYVIFTDMETFENTDSLFYWKWDSSDLYGDIKKGVQYRAHVYGFRVGILSWYRNIVSLEEIP